MKKMSIISGFFASALLTTSVMAAPVIKLGHVDGADWQTSKKVLHRLYLKI